MRSGVYELELKGGDRITVTYVDQLSDDGRPNQVRAATVDVLAGGDGSLTGPATLNAGDTLTLTLTDKDLSKHHIQIEKRFQVPAISLCGADDWLGEWTFALPAGSMTDEPILIAHLIARAGLQSAGWGCSPSFTWAST